MKRAFGRVAWALGLGLLATAMWLLVAPVTEFGVAGRLPGLIARKGTSDDALGWMWRLQLPGTALAACVFSLLVLRVGRMGLPNWGSAGTHGAAVGGSIALILFASPPPGAPALIWGATYYLTGLPAALLVNTLTSWLPPFVTFGGLLAFWPVVVTAVLASIGTLVGGIVGQALDPQPGPQ